MNQGRLAAYAAGNKVYGGGRPNPTSGPVDPTGYVDRDAKKKGSNRRSGLAAAAKRRMEKNNAAEQTESQQPTVPPALASTMVPLTLPDGRRIAPNMYGQYEWVTDPGESLEMGNGQ